jgi:hypothetical protein
MGCIPSQTDHREKQAINQHSKPLAVIHKESDVPARTLISSADQSNSVPPDTNPPNSLNTEIRPEVPSKSLKDQNFEKMDVEMTSDDNEQDYPAWEVLPLLLVRDGKIGRGGAGNVIKATDPSTGRVVALKVKSAFICSVFLIHHSILELLHLNSAIAELYHLTYISFSRQCHSI